jgi:hemoglobin-like flavoprotein
MLSDAEKTAIRESWRLVQPVVETAADLFYRRLAEQNPELRAQSQDQLIAQRKEFVTTFDFVARGLDWEASEWRQESRDDDDLFLGMLALGQRDSRLARLLDEQYSAAGESLLWTLTYTLGKRFDANARAAWMRLYTLLANAVRLGRLAGRDLAARRGLNEPQIVRRSHRDPGADIHDPQERRSATREPHEPQAVRRPHGEHGGRDPSKASGRVDHTPIARIRRGERA